MKKEKNKKPKRIFRKFFVIILCIIALNISLVYLNANPSNAETEVEVPDQEIQIEILDKTPEFTDAIDCYLYSEALFMKSTCYSRTTGSVKGYKLGKAWVHQTMDNGRYVTNDGYKYSTSVSLKKGTMGRNNYQHIFYDAKNNGSVYRIRSEEAGDGSGDFAKSEWEIYNKTEYENIAGNVPGEMLYNVRESTIDKVETFERTEDGGYHVRFILNNSGATKDYKRLLKNSVGSIAGNPTFSHVEVEVWMDKDCKFTKYIMKDEATISIMGLECKMVSNYEEVFYVVGGDVQAPFEAPIPLT